MTKKIGVILFLSLLVLFLGFSQSALVERYLTAANNSYSQKDYAKAFDYINYVFGQYTSENVPQNVEILAETIYYDYLQEIRDKKDTDAFAKVKEKLLEYPTLSSERVNRLVRTLNTMETQDQQWGPSVSVSSNFTSKEAAEYQAKLARAQAQLEAVEKALAEAKQNNQKDRAEALLKEQELLEKERNIYSDAIVKSNQTMKSNTIMIAIIALCLVGIIIGGVVVIVSVTKKSEESVRRQQEQFEATLQMVAQLTRNQKEAVHIAQISDVYNSEFGESSPRVTASLPDVELTDSEHQELKKLAAKCKEIGAKIDLYTSRKNNSKNVSEMVFKIANGLELNSYESMLYFCAAMVYDIGFLSVNSSLLTSESLTDEEKYQIRSHVKLGADKIDFVPEKYRSVFLDAILMHHENMDGTGYPAGVQGEKIPLIARIIHVVESFIALISRRNYHGIFDKESAIKELRTRPNFYDQKIVDVLDSLV
ncbi:MAG: HD domain-containing phosphohydrolase [Treponemataceae bacterium]|nr:HD domain-containing phosphohydrolase [Treponemataceae bacterium]